MARSGKPWAVVIAAIVLVLVTAAALVAAAVLRGHRTSASQEPTGTNGPTTTTRTIGVDGCLVAPCTVLGSVPVGGATVELVGDAGATSGRLRIGGGGAADVIEVTITSMGATLTTDSLQCISGTLAACVVRGGFPGGIAGQVVVGRSAEWSELAKPFVSDAGYLALAEMTGDVGPEVVAAQYKCDRTQTTDCSAKPVFVQVYSLRSELLGCTRTYSRLGSLPGYPAIDLTDTPLKPCA